MIKFKNRLERATVKDKEGRKIVSPGVYRAIKEEERMAKNRRAGAENLSQSEKNRRARKLLSRLGFSKLKIVGGVAVSAVYEDKEIFGDEIIKLCEGLIKKV